MKFTALVVVVEDRHEEEAIKVAKEAGAGAVTILHGRNIGLEEKKVFFGLTLEENVVALLFVLPRKLSMRVLKELREKLHIDADENNGFAFTVPLSHVAGLNVKELHKFEDDIKCLL
jgi:hypothetical protein